MSVLGVGATHLARGVGSGDELRSPMDSIRMAKDAMSMAGITSSPTSHLAVAAEELTFQFSEAVEAKETALEERLQRQRRVTEKLGSLSVAQIQAIMTLMEGKEGYEILRGQARSFATLYQTNPELAIKYIELDNIPSEKKYTLLSLATNTLGLNPNSRDAQIKLSQYIQQQNNPFQQPEQTNIFQAVSVKHRPSQQQGSSLPQVVSIQPSIKSLWDVINEKSNGNLLDAMRAIRSEWSDDQTFPLENIGALVIVHKIMTIIQSMHTHAEDIMKRIGVQDAWKGDFPKKQTKILIDLAQSSMPSSLIDRLVDSLKSSKRSCPRCTTLKHMACTTCRGKSLACDCKVDTVCRCTDFRGYILSLLHWHARQWPLEVWINDDAKTMVLDQLIKKQNAPTGLLAKRMMS